MSNLYETHKLKTRAAQKTSRAYAREDEAKALVADKKREAEEAVRTLAEKKRDILRDSMSQFVKVAEKVSKIEFDADKSFASIAACRLREGDVETLRSISVKAAEPLTKREWAMFILGGATPLPFDTVNTGLTAGVRVSAERDYETASRKLRAANIVYSQAVNIGKGLDVIIKKCSNVSYLLDKMNVLFMNSIAVSGELIAARGTNRANYSQGDRAILMICFNMADALKKIIDAPVLTREGEMAREIEEAVRDGAQHFDGVDMIE